MGICVSCRRRDLQAPEKRAGGAGDGRMPAKGAAAELLPRRVDPAMANSISNIKMTNPIKGIVSKRRKRYIKDGFNLDLAYITDRLIAMGFPAEKLEGVYRNHIDEVFRFLEQMHKDHYKIYNLCSERCYEPSKFHGRVARYAFEDHTPPKMELIQPFCEDVHKWLNEDPRNVAAVHCKAGKGRTGTMVCCYLLYCGQKATADEALKFYGTKRTHDEKGVTIPSQRRYVEYYAALVGRGLQYSPAKLHIRELVMSPPPALNGGQCTLELTVSQAQPSLKAPSGSHEVRKHDSHIRIVLDQCTPLQGDVRVDVYNKPKMMMRKEKLFHFWFNTFFVANGVGAVKVQPPTDSMNLDTFKLSLNKWQLDDAHKDKLHKIYSSDFKVEVVLQQQPPSSRFLAAGRAPPSPPSSSASDTDPEPDSEHWDSGELRPQPAHCRSTGSRAPSAHCHARDDCYTFYRPEKHASERNDHTTLNTNDCQRDEQSGERQNPLYRPPDNADCKQDSDERYNPLYRPPERPASVSHGISNSGRDYRPQQTRLMRMRGIQQACPHGCINDVTDAPYTHSQPDELCPHGYRIVTYTVGEVRSDCTERLDIECGSENSNDDISFGVISENNDVEMSSCNNCIQMDFSQKCIDKPKNKHDHDPKAKSQLANPIKTMENAGILTKDGYMLIDRTPRHKKDTLTRLSDPSHTNTHADVAEKCTRLSDPTGSRKCRHAGLVSKDGYMLVDATPRQIKLDGKRTPHTSTEVLGLPVVTNMRLNSETLAEDYMEFSATDGFMKAVDEPKITNYSDEYAPFMLEEMADDKTALCDANNCKIIAETSEKDDVICEAGFSEAAQSVETKSGKNKKHSFFKRDDYKNDKGKIPKVSSDHTISDDTKKKYNFLKRRDDEGAKTKFVFGDMRASWRELSSKFSDHRKKKDRDDS